ncbi:S41 family peptidase [Myxococcus sp. K15C18031901]|uniref:S41 family peptidase n=1 Tax=Myxococcus dinghuensis TaxID=2906761 RepID=UPI0020A81C11|nr:S41 family peptidase [Myxococcus dinghuensis]MCP3099095.1 S41 family peptidase [Myxococcus dinghuensis]
MKRQEPRGMGMRARGALLAGCLLLASVVQAATPPPFAKLGDEVVELVRTRFFDAKRAEAWATAHQGYGAAATSAEDFERRTTEVLSELKASHTAYYPRGSQGHTALSAIFQRYLELARVDAPSIGADVQETPEGFFLRHVFVGGPAAKAGLLRGDRLVSVEGKPFVSLAALDARVGKPTRFGVERTRGGEPLTLTVTPRRVNPKGEWLEAQQASSRVVERSGRRVAYQQLYSCAGPEHQQKLEETLGGDFAQADALVLDFRDGWGGCNPQFLNLFDRAVPTFTGIRRDGTRNTWAPTWRKPVVLLVNDNSRSGKELVAFAMKRHGLATLVGQRTAGAVLAGTPLRLSNGALLYLAVEDVEVDGTRLEGQGVPVDVEVADSLPFAGGGDVQLDKALDVAARAVAAP